MGLSAKEAADQVGMSKQGIIKAIRTGKISAQKDQQGEWQIEPVELFRVYKLVDRGMQQPASTSLQQDTPEDIASLQVEIRLLRDRLADKDDVIGDLRQRLDAESEERRRLSLLLTAAPAHQPRSWWARMLGRGE